MTEIDGETTCSRSIQFNSDSGFFLQFGHFFQNWEKQCSYLINNYSNYDIYKVKPVLRGHLWDKEKVTL